MRSKLKHEPFYIVADNVLTTKEIEIIKDEAGKEKYERLDTDYYHYDRFAVLDKHRTLKIVEALIYQKKWWDMALGTPDLAWAGSCPNYTVSITKYKDGDWYMWHSDASGQKNLSSRGRALSFIIYLTDTGFTGGETQFSLECGNFFPEENKAELWKSIEPKVGRLLIFPSWVLHRVNKVEGKEPRTVVNGHLNLTEYRVK